MTSLLGLTGTLWFINLDLIYRKNFEKKLEKHGREIIVLHCTEYSVGELLNVYLTLVLFISKDRMHVGL